MSRRPPFSSAYTVKSRAASSVVADFATVPGAESTRTIYATIQPLDARQLKDLAPGLQSRARYACFTFEALNSARPGGQLPDLVVVGSLDYEVHGGYDDGRFPGAPFAGYEYILAEPEGV